MSLAGKDKQCDNFYMFSGIQCDCILSTEQTKLYYASFWDKFGINSIELGCISNHRKQFGMDPTPKPRATTPIIFTVQNNDDDIAPNIKKRVLNQAPRPSCPSSK